jgi:single-stranded DNA-binding protein
MAASVNKCILVGTIGTKGFEVRYNTNGTAVAAFFLACAEQWTDGKEHLTLIPCEVLGRRAEVAAEMEPGTAVCVDGKVLRRRVGDRYETVIACWDLVPVTVPATPVEAA